MPFNEDVAAVKSNGKWGYIDRMGRFRVPPRYDRAWTFEGLAGVKLNGRWGYIRDNGEVAFGL
jgi:hypothetical protein